MVDLNLLLSLILNYYLLDKNVTIVYFFNCRSTTGKTEKWGQKLSFINFPKFPDNLHINKYLSEHGIAIGSIQLNAQIDVQNYSHLINQKYTPSTGIMLDYDCPSGVDLIELSSQNECFSTKNKWLIFEEIGDIHTSSLLNHLNMSNLFVTAEISYFNPALAFLDNRTK